MNQPFGIFAQQRASYHSSNVPILPAESYTQRLVIPPRLELLKAEWINNSNGKSRPFNSCLEDTVHQKAPVDLSLLPIVAGMPPFLQASKDTWTNLPAFPQDKETTTFSNRGEFSSTDVISTNASRGRNHSYGIDRSGTIERNPTSQDIVEDLTVARIPVIPQVQQTSAITDPEPIARANSENETVIQHTSDRTRPCHQNFQINCSTEIKRQTAEIEIEDHGRYEFHEELLSAKDQCFVKQEQPMESSEGSADVPTDLSVRHKGHVALSPHLTKEMAEEQCRRLQDVESNSHLDASESLGSARSDPIIAYSAPIRSEDFGQNGDQIIILPVSKSKIIATTKSAAVVFEDAAVYQHFRKLQDSDASTFDS